MAGADGPPASPDRQTQPRVQIQQQIRNLDDACYEVRCGAAKQLEQWLEQPDFAPLLSAQFEHTVLVTLDGVEILTRREAPLVGSELFPSYFNR